MGSQLLDQIPIFALLTIVFISGMNYYRLLMLERTVSRIEGKIHNGLLERIVKIEETLRNLECNKDVCKNKQ